MFGLEPDKSVEFKFAKIVYKPHCSMCGSLIDIGVEYQDVYEDNEGNLKMRKIGANIWPNKCEHCGTIFESIEITPPKKLENDIIEYRR